MRLFAKSEVLGCICQVEIKQNQSYAENITTHCVVKQIKKVFWLLRRTEKLAKYALYRKGAMWMNGWQIWRKSPSKYKYV